MVKIFYFFFAYCRLQVVYKPLAVVVVVFNYFVVGSNFMRLLTERKYKYKLNIQIYLTFSTANLTVKQIEAIAGD